MIYRQLLFALFTILLLCVPATAQAVKPDTISGRVITDSGRPLPGARITLIRVDSSDLRNVEAKHATSDAEGRFEMSGLKPANYVTRAFLKGYAPLLRVADIPVDFHRVGDFVNVVMTKGGVITGRVTTQTGEPVVGVRVSAQMVNLGITLPVGSELFGLTALTDDRGIYRIYGLPAASYVVWAGGSSLYRGSGGYADLDPYDQDVRTFAPSSTPDTAQEFVVHAGAETNVDIQYRGGSGHAVSGKVSGPKGAPPLAFAITLTASQSTVTSYQRPGASGFMFEGVDDGEYQIMAVSFTGEGEYMFAPTKQIKVSGADVTGVELMVEPTVSIAGRVVLEETKVTECTDKQRPIFSETLISPQTDKLTSFQPRWAMTRPMFNPDEQGNVVLKTLAPGRYRFVTQHFAKDWYLKSITLPSQPAGKPVDAARTWTTLKPGDRLSGLTITLAQGAASVRGEIAVSEGETVAGKSYVYLVPAENDPLRFSGAAVTSEGKVAFNNLAPGRYFVFATKDESESPLTKLDSPDETAHRSKLRREAEAVKHEIELKPCQKVIDLKVRMANQNRNPTPALN